MSPFSVIEDYVARAEGLVEGAEPAIGEIQSLLNGGPSSATQQLAIETRKELGAFFTPANLAERLVRPHRDHLANGGTVLDPACGVGELLLACTRLVDGHLTPTQIKGVDIVPEFVRLCRARLSIASQFYYDWAASIDVADGLDALAAMAPDTVVVMNPPYAHSVWPADATLGRGRTTLAAIFLWRTVAGLPSGGQLSAILPDVIRTGSRYAKLRNFVAKNLEAIEICSIGRFDENADVDVFILRGTKRNCEDADANWPSSQSLSARTVDDGFVVRVGSVVPHRDEEDSSMKRRYLHASSAKPWTTVTTDALPLRGYHGTPHRPPFVAVRRTSSPSDKWRAAATLVRGNETVAVENHIIVLKPKDRSVASCESLLEALRSSATNDWLNEAIRCRHLTVGVLRRLPLRF